ncbi:SIR2-like domain-containing protein [Xylaria venustula]|nr:SIR2-like domain-containing protein [Xylaria venustula]
MLENTIPNAPNPANLGLQDPHSQTSGTQETKPRSLDVREAQLPDSSQQDSEVPNLALEEHSSAGPEIADPELQEANSETPNSQQGEAEKTESQKPKSPTPSLQDSLPPNDDSQNDVLRSDPESPDPQVPGTRSSTRLATNTKPKAHNYPISNAGAYTAVAFAATIPDTTLPNDPVKRRKTLESQRIQDEAAKLLREQLKAGRLAICVGSGVTLYSASSQTQRLSWWGLMSNALDYFEDQAASLQTDPVNQVDLATARAILEKNNPTEADRDDVTNRIQKLLGSRIDLETTWMRAQFQNLYLDHVDQHEILDAIRSLQQAGALLFTTNYDDLLERHCNLDPIDGSDPNGLMAYRRGSRPAIFHPHGFWKNANNIVLSAEAYWRVKNDKIVQETLQHILATKTVLFVGCGGGLSDPNFGSLINWVGERNIGINASHYILLQKSEQNPVTQLPLIHLRCESFDDIPRYLKDLLDPGERREGSLSELPWDSERRRINDWLAPVNQSDFLTDMLNLQGPNRFDRQVTRSQDVWSLNTPSRVRLMGQGGYGKTMFSASVIHHTLRDCRPSSWKRSRDSLAYFFCATYKPYIREPNVQFYNFHTFLRTVISQLCPPRTVFPSLLTLYTDCTRYHPARLPTKDELQAVLMLIIQDLDKSYARKNGEALEPGETYLVIDELETIPANMQSDYSVFIKAITNLPLKHLHILVTANNPFTIGLAPPVRPRSRRGRGTRTRERVSLLKQAISPGAKQWAEVILDWNTTETAAMEWLRHRFANDPFLANYVNIRQDIMLQIHMTGQNLRWIYWKLQELSEIGATQDLDDKGLSEAATDALEEDDDDDDTDVLPDRKRGQKKDETGRKKKRKNKT